MDHSGETADEQELKLVYEIMMATAGTVAQPEETAAERELQLAYEIMMHRLGMRANNVGTYYSRNFGRGQNPVRNQSQPPNRGNASSPSAYTPPALAAPNIPPAPPSPSLTQSMSNNDQAHQTNHQTNQMPLFFKEEYSGFIVKGNFTTLSAKPLLLEEGEWLAHQGD